MYYCMYYIPLPPILAYTLPIIEHITEGKNIAINLLGTKKLLLIHFFLNDPF